MMRHAFARLLLGFTLLFSCLTATGQEARPGDVQLAGRPPRRARTRRWRRCRTSTGAAT